LEFTYSFNPSCYILVAGEALRMSATYARQDTWLAPPPGSELMKNSVWTDWHDIVVPSGWKGMATAGEPPVLP
jgi:hypothetical protein